MEGEMLRYEPPSVMEFKWGDDDVLAFTLRPDGSGTVLTLVQTFDQLGKAARDGAGWHACLDELDYHLRGEKPRWEPNQHWRDLHESYVQRFGEEASTIGPPEGHPVTEQA
jgi:hypothetical protein